MKRTQIYLTPAQHDYLWNKAKENKTTLSEEIRRAIDLVRFEKKSSGYQEDDQAKGNFFLKLSESAAEVKYGKSLAPDDIAENMDKYLYEEPYE